MVDNQNELLAGDDLGLGSILRLGGRVRDDTVPDDSLGPRENIFHELRWVNNVQGQVPVSQNARAATRDAFPGVLGVHKLNIGVHGFTLALVSIFPDSPNE
jgi:hypothetical protein